MRRGLGRAYNRLLTGYAISNVGNGVLLAALPLLVASNTRNPLVISGLTVAAGLPWIIVGPLSGAIVDRVDRRSVMVLAEVSRAGLMGAAALYVFGGGESIIALYGLLILVGVGETFFDPAGLALVPGLVSPSQLDAANSRLYGIQILVQRFVGPPIGGWLFALAAWAPLGVDALSFLAAGMVVLGLPRGTREKPSEHHRPGLLTETVEGVRWVWRHSVLRAFMVGAGALHFATAAGLSVLVLLAQDRFGLTGFGFGLTMGGLAVGYFLGYVVAPSITARLPRVRICVGALVGVTGGFFLIAVSGFALLGGLGLALVGLLGAQFDVVAISYRQSAVPDHVLGRVFTSFLFVTHGAIPVGALVGGMVAGWAGVGYAYVAAALVVAVVTPFLWVALKGEELDPERLQGNSPESWTG
ncbi:MAG: MFS transporter [Acidimicrobiia bacterium]|nr:MFS transporter [Acidimicrobiia bacterium]